MTKTETKNTETAKLNNLDVVFNEEKKLHFPFWSIIILLSSGSGVLLDHGGAFWCELTFSFFLSSCLLFPLN